MALDICDCTTRRSVPVVDAERRVLAWCDGLNSRSAARGPVSAVMDPFVHEVRASNAIEALLPPLSSGAAQETMTVDANRTLHGIITQADLLAVLYRAHIDEAMMTQRAEEAREIDPAI